MQLIIFEPFMLLSSYKIEMSSIKDKVLVCCLQAGGIDSEEIEVRMLVHQSHAGRIIGKGGEKVKKFRAVSAYRMFLATFRMFLATLLTAKYCRLYCRHVLIWHLNCCTLLTACRLVTF